MVQSQEHFEEIKRRMENSCLNKKALTQHQADMVTDLYIKKGRLFYYYKCGLCGSFHMTSSPPDPYSAGFKII